MALKKFGNTFGNKLLNQSVIDEDSPKRAKKLVDDSSQMPERPSKEQIEEYARSLKDKTGLEPMPVFRDSNGKINPKYKASRGQGALAGGAAAPMNGNPFHDLFSSIGGIAGGAVSPVLASKQKYVEDVKNIQLQNQTTEAHMRLQAQAELVNKRQTEIAAIEQKAAADAALKNETVLEKKQKMLKDYISNTSGAAKINYQREHAKNAGLDNWETIEQEDPDYMTSGWQEVKGDTGDIVFQKNSRGEFRAATVTIGGKEVPVSKLGLNDLWNVAAKANKLTMESDIDSEDVQNAFREADKVLLNPENKIKFVDAKGRINNNQLNAHRLQIANKILAAKKANPNIQTKQIIVNIAGTEMEISVPLIGQKKPMEQTQPAQNGDVNQTSPFMQDASQQGDGKVVDGTTGQPMATPAKQEKPPEGYDLTLDDSRTKKSYWAREIAPVNFPKGKTRVTKGGKEYIFENGKYYELVPR